MIKHVPSGDIEASFGARFLWALVLSCCVLFPHGAAAQSSSNASPDKPASSSTSKASTSTALGYANRLIREKSPYLLLHAHNPVDWYPWGEEAFAKARRENKPIFLSIGYYTCHWCHVMERESFENKEIAQIMNCPIGTVRSRIFRAREAVAEKLRPQLGTSKDKRW